MNALLSFLVACAAQLASEPTAAEVSAPAAAEERLPPAEQAQLERVEEQLVRVRDLLARLHEAQANERRRHEEVRALLAVEQEAAGAAAAAAQALAPENAGAGADDVWRRALEGQSRAQGIAGEALSPIAGPEAHVPAQDPLLEELRRERDLIETLARRAPTSRLAKDFRALEEARREAEGLARKLAEDIEHARFAEAREALALAAMWHETRLALLPRLSPALDAEVHRFTELAGRQLEVAGRHAWLELRVHARQRLYEVLHLRDRYEGVLSLSVLLWHWGQAAGWLLLYAWARRQGPRLLSRARRTLLSRSASTRSARWWEALFRGAALVGPRALVLVGVQVLFDTLASAAPRPELDLLASLVTWIVVYQLVLEGLNLAVLRVAGRYRALADATKARVLSTLLLATRYAFVVTLLLGTVERFFGRGIWLELLTKTALWLSLPLSALLIERWRGDIVHAYLARWPDSRLARQVQASPGRWSAFFLASAAFAFVAAQAIVQLGRDFVMGFDQTRRALAFVFRLRVERQARERTRPRVRPEELPLPLLQAFREPAAAKVCGREPDIDDAAAPAPVLLERFPGLEEVLQGLAPPSAGAPAALGGVFLVHGAPGVGLTTWMDELCRRVVPVASLQRFTPCERYLSASSLADALAGALGLEACTDAAALAHALCRLPPRVVVIDDLEWFFLRALGGYDALDAFWSICRATRGHVSWCCSVSTPAFVHLAHARDLRARVTSLHAVGLWGEAEIRELIQRRQAQSGLSVSFEDLLVQESAGLAASAQVVETQDGYIRLLWNVSEGNPKIAQHYWLRSLRHDEAGHLRVQLYDAPSADDLEGLPSDDRFLLAALVLHRALSPAELARTCHVSLDDARDHFARGSRLGVYRPWNRGSAAERFAVDLHFQEAVTRFLRRKNLS